MGTSAVCSTLDVTALADIDGLAQRLVAAGIEVERRGEWETEYGRFARIHDPEGLPIELWEPPQA